MITGSARTTAPEVPANSMARIVFPVDTDGLVLGRDSTGRPVLLRIFDAAPRRVVFVGGWWAAQILLCRCLAVGAMVAVDTNDAAPDDVVAECDHWLALGQLATGSPGRIRPMPAEVDTWPATAAQPVLRLADVGPGGTAITAPGRPWHTELTVLSTVGPAALPAIAAADVVLVQRLGRADAEQVCGALQLGPEYAPMLGAMENEMVAAFGGGLVRYSWLTPTPLERQLFG
jgi:hypothetical protein